MMDTGFYSLDTALRNAQFYKPIMPGLNEFLWTLSNEENQ